MLTSLMFFQCGWKQSWKGKQKKVKMRWSWHYDRSHRILQTFPSAQGTPVSTESHPLQHQLLWIQPRVCKNHSTFFHISTDFQCWSHCDCKKSTYFIFTFVASECWKFCLFQHLVLKVNVKKLLYQKRRVNSCLFLFNVVNQIVTTKSRAQSLVYSWFPYTGEILSCCC